jgi:myo-inositol-1(or 4)-monophosphatase
MDWYPSGKGVLLVDVAKAKKIAIQAAKAGGEALLHVYREGAYSTRVKEDTSLQTEADLLAEKAIIELLQAAFPDHAIESEEQGLLPHATSPYRWKIDPLDGTENFVQGLPYFSSTLTFYDHDQPLLAVVYDPVMETLYTAERDGGAWLNETALRVSQTSNLQSCRVFLIPDFATKRLPPTSELRRQMHLRCRRVLDTWSPALDWCLVASGKADVVVAIASQPILPDAGTLMLEKAGGWITDFQGRPFTGENQCCLVGSNGTDLHRQFLKLAQNINWEDESWMETSRSKSSYGIR